jgi:hypothetical protein
LHRWVGREHGRPHIRFNLPHRDLLRSIGRHERSRGKSGGCRADARLRHHSAIWIPHEFLGSIGFELAPSRRVPVIDDFDGSFWNCAQIADFAGKLRPSMPTLVHITDEKNSARIRRSGIALGKSRRVIFFMPVVQDHFISHQWVRELRRGGARVLVGVYFRMRSEDNVWAGRYNDPHREMSLGQAIRELNALPDPLGFEIFIDKKIEANAITRIRHLPQKIGWRYEPYAHGKRPCGCPACLPKGSYKSRQIRQEYDPEPISVPYETLKARLAESSDTNTLIDCLWLLRSKRRKADPAFLERLTSIDDMEVQEDLARTLGHFKHENSIRMLLTLCRHDSAEVREAAAESLLKLYGHDAAGVLSPFSSDPVIAKVIANAI